MNFLRSKKQDCCCICLDESPDVANLCCGSASHFRCLRKWAESDCGVVHKEVACPMCRHPFMSKIDTITPPGPMPTPIQQPSPSPPTSNDRFVPTLRSPPPMGVPVHTSSQIYNELWQVRSSLLNQAGVEIIGMEQNCLWTKVNLVIQKTPTTLLVLLILLYLTFASAMVFASIRISRFYSEDQNVGTIPDQPILSRNNLIEATLYTLSAVMIVEMTRAVFSSSRDV